MPRTAKLLVLALALAPPLSAAAQDQRSSDLAYCAKLGELYIRYVANGEFSPLYDRRPEVEGRVAIAKCEAGDSATAIPILERKLTNAKVELPPRK